MRPAIQRPKPVPGGVRATPARERGQATVELAVAVPVLAMILLAIVQLGTALHDRLELTAAARDGVRTASTSRTSATGVQDAIDAARGGAPDLDQSKLGVSVSPGQPWSAGDDVTVTVSYPYSIDILGLVVASGTMRVQNVAAVQ